MHSRSESAKCRGGSCGTPVAFSLRDESGRRGMYTDALNRGIYSSKMAEPFCLAAWRTKSDTLPGSSLSRCCSERSRLQAARAVDCEAFPARTRGPALQSECRVSSALPGPEDHGTLARWRRRATRRGRPGGRRRSPARCRPGSRPTARAPASPKTRKRRPIGTSVGPIRPATNPGPAEIGLPACLHQKHHHYVYA